MTRMMAEGISVPEVSKRMREGNPVTAIEMTGALIRVITDLPGTMAEMTDVIIVTAGTRTATVTGVTGTMTEGITATATEETLIIIMTDLPAIMTEEIPVMVTGMTIDATGTTEEMTDATTEMTEGITATVTEIPTLVRTGMVRDVNTQRATSAHHLPGEIMTVAVPAINVLRILQTVTESIGMTGEAERRERNLGRSLLVMIPSWRTSPARVQLQDGLKTRNTSRRRKIEDALPRAGFF